MPMARLSWPGMPTRVLRHTLARHTPFLTPLMTPPHPRPRFASFEAQQVHEYLQGHNLDKWGWVIYRTSYKDDAAWERFQRYITTWSREALKGEDASHLVSGAAEWTFVSDPALDGASREQLRARFREWRKTAIQAENPRLASLPTTSEDMTQRYIYFVQVDEEALGSAAVQESAPHRDAGVVRFVRCDGDDALEQPLGRLRWAAGDDEVWTMMPKRIVSTEFWVNVCISVEHWDCSYSIDDVMDMEIEALEWERERTSAAFSPDGRLIVLGCQDKTVRVWDVAACAERHVLRGHGGRVTAVAFSPDNRLIASGSSDNTVRVWDVATGAEQLVLQGHYAWVPAVVFSPDGRLIVSASNDQRVRVWDAATGEAQCLLHSHRGSVNAVAFSPDGRRIVTGSYDTTIRIWDAATYAEQPVLHRHLDSVKAVAFSPDSRLIASGSYDNTVGVWDAATGALQRNLHGHSNWVHAVAFSPDGRLIVSSSYDNTIRIWDAATGTERHVLHDQNTIPRFLSFSPGGKHLATDRGILRLPYSDCSCSHRMLATRSWMTDNGEQLLYIKPLGEE